MEQKILRNLIEDAKEVYKFKEVLQQVAVTQAIHESGFLNKSGGSQLAVKYNNLFGIKAVKGQPSVKMRTWEHINGKDIQVYADFAWYDSFTDSFVYHRKLMEKPRYSRVIASKTVSEAFNMLQACGYATDPRYPQKLQKVYDLVVKPEFEKPAKPTPKPDPYIDMTNDDLLRYEE